MAAAYLLGLCTGGAEKPVPRSIHVKCYLESYGIDHSSRNVKALPGLGGCLNAVKAGGSYYRYKTKMNLEGMSLLAVTAGRVTYGIRESASPRHAPVLIFLRFRGAGCGVRGGGAPDGALFLWGLCTGVGI